jgi:uncharacterized membrane protein YjgN (DUF898 family)
MNWYYKSEGERCGPVTEGEIGELVSNGVVNGDTEIWDELNSQWRPLRDMPLFAHLFQQERDAPDVSFEASQGHDGPPMDAPEEGQAPPRYPPAAPQTESFAFTGTGGEYFRIWIVNLLLSIVTLGIYTAWAKVRKNQYFYRHMQVAGSSFDYHGNPIAILKGRIIAVVLLFAYNFAPSINIYLYYFVLLLLIVIFPYLFIRSFVFRLHNTSWRNIRFRFHGRVKDAARILYGYGLLIAISLGLCYPLAYQRIRVFLYNHASFGKTFFRLDVGAVSVYGVFLKTAGFGVFVAVVAYGLSKFAMIPGSYIGPNQVQAMFRMVIISMAIFYLLCIFLVYPFFQANITNLIWNHVRLGPVRFTSSQTTASFAFLIFSNTLLTLVTLGFYWPWAAVRMARYRAQRLTLDARLGVDHFAADAEADMAAVGEEVTDVFDFDISF